MPKRILWVWRLFFYPMKTTQFLLTFFIGLLLLAPLHPAHPHAVNGEDNHSMVDILDPELRKRVAASFSPPKAPNDPITANDMQNVESVRADGPDIRHLTGLEHAINLTYLRLLQPRPSTEEERNASPRFDLTPLAGLTKLEHLDLQNVIISDMAPLRNLTKLKYLALSHTYNISEIPDLSKLTELVYLRLGTNRITDISGVRGLTNLRHLDLANNWDLSDITPLATLRNLESLRLENTLVTHTSLSAVLPFMSTEIDQMPINEYPPVAFTSGGLGIGGNNISDLSVLDSLPNVFLWDLFLRFMGRDEARFFHLTDLTPLVDLMNKGKVINSKTAIRLGYNYALDYASLYEDLPALITGSRLVNYVRGSIPMLEIEPPPPAMVEIDLQEKTEASYRGHPSTRYTFSVRAVNTHPTFPGFLLDAIPYDTGDNRQFAEAPVTFTVTNPDDTTETDGPVLTGDDGLTGVTLTLGDDGDIHTVEAVIPANAPIPGEIEHPELRVTFTVRADRTVPPPSNLSPDSTDRLTVSFEDYPEERPIDECTLTIRFSEPIIGFEETDITVHTELISGEGRATLKALAPDSPEPNPMQRCIATIALPAQAAGTVRLIVRKDAATTPATASIEKTGPSSNTASKFIAFGPVYDEDARFRHPPALVVTQIDFAKGRFSVQNTTQYQFNVEMRIYSEDHKDRWFRISERDLIPIEDAETLAFSLTPVETDDASIIHLNSERLLRQNQNQPLKLSSQKFCIKLMRVIPIDTASNMNEDFRIKEPRWTAPGEVIFRQYDASWDLKLKGLRRDHLPYYRFPLDGRLSDSWDVEASVPAAPSVSRVQSEVVLSAFRAASTASGVIVEWTTASERANAGFYVLRSRTRKSGFVGVSPRLIVGAGTTTEGQTYSWQDTTAAVNVPYYYRLEGVSFSGERRELGTVRLRGFISSAGKLLWKWADVKSEAEE